MFHASLEEMIQFDEHIFQMGWFNHQLENDSQNLWMENEGTFFWFIEPIFWGEIGWSKWEKSTFPMVFLA